MLMVSALMRMFQVGDGVEPLPETLGMQPARRMAAAPIINVRRIMCPSPTSVDAARWFLLVTGCLLPFCLRIIESIHKAVTDGLRVFPQSVCPGDVLTECRPLIRIHF